MRILYLYLNPSEEKYQRIVAGEIPSDSMYGLIELQKLGYDVSFRDSRPKGPLSKFIININKKYDIYLKDLKTLLYLKDYDVIVVNGPFSTLVTIACRIYNKKIVYLDALLMYPENKIRKLIYRINLMLSSGTILYSKTQIGICSKVFNVPIEKFKLIRFGIDVPFYRCSNNGRKFFEPFLLSVGRDTARDYKTLVDSLDGLGVRLKIVTLPYLMKDVILNNPLIEVLENISYEELFQLYAESIAVVIPIKKWGSNHSSGTRALLEAKALGKIVIASKSAPLMEYFEPGKGVIYVPPENVHELRKGITGLLENKMDRVRRDTSGMEHVKKEYNMDAFATVFGRYLSGLFEETKKNISH